MRSGLIVTAIEGIHLSAIYSYDLFCDQPVFAGSLRTARSRFAGRRAPPPMAC